ncbi:protein arginine methyltransferase NDUFAF7 homolog, mitochondrial [Planococcus citri]|uniref:protein arginine methyltransferase NDUFAF7 homolog, mitochondrial n=1 Tax=Planococcus citri TaxID=170843 RepID=UPI0031F75B60
MIKIYQRLAQGAVSFLRLPNCRHCLTKLNYSTSNTPASIQEIIRQKIKATGPVPLPHFIKEVLTNPVYGYYTTRDVFGREGDFVTSPEISQLFGELIAVWFINEWAKVGQPKPFNFVELGPGRGTMMRDMLKVFCKFKLNQSCSVHLIEVSEVLSNIQAEKLGVTIIPGEEDLPYYKYGKTNDGVEVFWYKSLSKYKYKRFSLIVAHEFFDALPIHKFKKTEKGWCEVLVDIDRNDPNEKKFRFVLSSGPTTMSKVFVSPEETRNEIEVNSESILCMGNLASSMECYGGIALIIDYGHCGTKTDTFRAYRNHTQCHPLDHVGDADLTADVDFSSLIRAVYPKLITFGPVTQQQFLKQMQIDVRLQHLLEKCNDEKIRENLEQGYHTLVDEDKMGSRFHFLSFFPAVLHKFLNDNPVVGFLNNVTKNEK